MKKLLLFPLLVLSSFVSKAQISGSDTACAAYIYSYSVNIPGAVTYNWTLPNGWYFFSGQGTDSIVVNCNDSVGQICVTGYDASGIVVNSVCKNVTWGTGGMGWYVSGTPVYLPPCYTSAYYILSISPQLPGCPGSCGNGIQNPNIIFAGFDNPWPSGNYMGEVNGATGFYDVTGFGTTVYVYEVDTTFGIDSMLLVLGGNGCGLVNNTFFIPGITLPWPNFVPLILNPDSVCVGDTFTVSVDPLYTMGISVFNFYSSSDVLIISQSGATATAVLTGTTNASIDFEGSDWSGCSRYYGFTNILLTSCFPPVTNFIYNSSISFCQGGCIDFLNSTANATSYQWLFPGGIPASSTASAPPWVCYNVPGQYDVTLIATNSAGSDTLTIPNLIHVFPSPTVNLIQSNDTLIATQGNSTYNWSYNGQFIMGAMNSFYVANQNGVYSVVVFDSNGCMGRDTFTVMNLVTSLTGSDTACAGYIYSYQASIPGAVSYQWKLPTGWYFLSGQGTDSVVVNCNDSVGTVCVTGYDAWNLPLDTLCKVISWGTGGMGWYVSGTSVCSPPCYNDCYYILSISPQLPGCPGSCGNGIQNPNVIFAGFDNPWPNGNFMGVVNGATSFYDVNGWGTTVYVYEVDTTFGLDSMLLVSGGNGCGPVNNTFYIPGSFWTWPTYVVLSQSPNPVCVGDTFTVYVDSWVYGWLTYFYFSTWSPQVTLISQSGTGSVTAVLTAASTSASIDFSGSDIFGCNAYYGNLVIAYSSCSPPNSNFNSPVTSSCQSGCFNFSNNSVDATSYEWLFPGGTPATSTASIPPQICYNAPGQYDVTLIATNSTGSDTLTISNYIQIFPPPAVNIIQSNDTLMTMQNFTTYQWLFNGLPIIGAVNSIYVANQNGMYSVSVTDNNGCVGSDSIVVINFITALTGSDTACAGYIYSYQASIPGAVSYTWQLPTGWYFLSGQGTDSVVVNCNDTIGNVCVIGYDAGNQPLDTLCKAVSWGTGGIGWDVRGNRYCDPPCYIDCHDVLYIDPLSPGCPGSCGNGYSNPNIIFAGFDNPWPSGLFLGIVDGVNAFYPGTSGLMVYVYPVDTTFGLDSMLLVKGGNGCGPVNNTIYLPGIFISPPYFVTLFQNPNSICVGDTFNVSVDPLYAIAISSFSFYVGWGDATIISQAGGTVTAVLTGPSSPAIFFNGSDGSGCISYYGSMNVNLSNCNPPVPLFNAAATTFCQNACVNFNNSTVNATSYQWFFPGGLPGNSTSSLPPQVCYNFPGQYDVTLIATNGSGSDTLTIANYIQIFPPPAVNIIQSNDTLMISQSFASYQWSYNGLPISGALNSFYVTNINGLYSVLVTDANGCVGSDTFAVMNFVTALTGSDTACAGYIYTYQASIPGAVSYNWQLPTGWYFLSGQGTDSVVVNCNDTIGNVCVIGYDAGNQPLDTLCKAVSWGTGGIGWNVQGTRYCDPPCYFACQEVLRVNPQGPGCNGGCGNGYKNPNIIFAAFDNPWPSGMFQGIVNGSNSFYATAFGRTIYVYPVDTTFGLDSMLLLKGGSGCGIVDNIYFIGPNNCCAYLTMPLIQSPDPVCVGDTFTVSANPFYIPDVATFNWSTNSPNIVILGPSNNYQVTGVLLATGLSQDIVFSGTSIDGCHTYSGFLFVNSVTCPAPSVLFTSTDSSGCPGTCISFSNLSSNATGYQWFFPGGNPSASTAANPGTVCYNSPGQYNVTLIATNNFTSSTLQRSGYITIHPLPPANAGADQGICNGDSATLTASGGTSYLWASSGSTSNTQTVTPLTSSEYIVQVTDANGCRNFDSVFVTVHALPIANAGSDQSVCLGSSLNLSASGGLNYSWSPGGGTGGLVSVSPGVSSDYVVLVTDTNGCQDDDTVHVTVNTLPVVSAGTNQPVCIGDFASLTATPGFSYLWTTGSTNQSISVNPSATSDFIVQATDSNGCINTDTVTVIVNNLPLANAGVDQEICLGNSATFIASGGTAYLWISSGSTSNAQTVTPPTSSEYIVQVTDANGCRNFDSVFVTVHALPIANAGSDQSVCLGSSLNLSASGGLNYSWSPGGSTGGLLSVSPGISSDYIVLVTDSNGCQDDDTIHVTVNTLPVVSAGTNQPVCIGNFATLTATPGFSYLWTTGSTNQSISVNPSVTSDFIVQATDSNGCINTDTVTVVVNNLPIAYAGIDKEVCMGNSTTLIATGGTQYSWSPTGSINNIISVAPNQSTNYVVKVTDANGCIAYDTVNVQVHLLPNADAGQDQVICLGTTATLEATGGVLYTWITAGMNGATYLVSPLQTTKYLVVVTDSNGCTAMDSVHVTVNPLPDAYAGSDQVLCLGTSVLLVATGGNNYSWISVGVNNDSLFILPAVSSNYIVQVTDLNGCVNTDTVAVTVNPLPDASAGTDQDICEGMSAHLVASGGIGYSWNPTGETTNQITVAPETSIHYVVEVTDANGCRSSDTVYVGVNPRPLPDFNITSFRCENMAVAMFNASTIPSGSISNYHWDFGDGSSSILPDPLHTYSDTGNFALEIIATSNYGCMDTMNSVIHINPSPVVYFASENLCLGQPVQFTNLSTISAGTMTLWSWNFGDGTNGNIQNPVHSYSSAGLFDIQLTVVSDSGCSASRLIQQSLEVFPLPDVLFQTNPAEISFLNPTVHFINQSTGGVSWQWNFGDNNGFSFSESPDYIYQDTGIFTVTLQAVSMHGCVNTSVGEVTIKPDFTVYFPNSFTPNGDGLNDYFAPQGFGITGLEMRIYNRWGEEIFFSNSINVPWDGRSKANGQLCGEEMYVYFVRVADYKNRWWEYQGRVNLVR